MKRHQARAEMNEADQLAMCLINLSDYTMRLKCLIFKNEFHGRDGKRWKINPNFQIMFSGIEACFRMFDKSIESNQKVKEVFKDYGIHFRRFESNIEQGKYIMHHIKWTIYYDS